MPSVGVLYVKLKADSQELKKTMMGTVKTLRAQGKAFKTMGKDWSMAISAPLIGVGVVAVKAFTQWEDAAYAVKREVKATADEHEALLAHIREIGRSGPVAASAVADIAAAAGSMSMSAPQVEAMTDAVVKMVTITRKDGPETAKLMARLAELIGVAAEDYDNLASSIVGVGEVARATEEDIINQAQRFISVGKEAKLTGGEIIGLSAAAAGLGVKATQSGRLFSGLLRTLNASQFGTITDGFVGMAEIMGVTTDELAAKVRTDLIGTLGELLTAMNGMQESGEATVGEMAKRVGVTNKLLADAFSRAITGQSEFNEALKAGKTAWEDQALLMDRYNTATNTTTNRWKTLKNQLNDIALDLGEELVPVLIELTPSIKELATSLSKIVEGFSKLSPEMKENIIKLLAFNAAVGPLLYAVGGLAAGFGAIVAVAARLAPVWAAIRAGIAGISVALGVGATGPVGWGLAAALALIVGIWTNWDKIEPILRNVAEAVKKWVSGAITDALNWCKTAIDDVTGAFRNLWEKVAGHSYIPDLGNTVVTESQRMTSALGDLADSGVRSLQSTFADLESTGTEKWERFRDSVVSGLVEIAMQALVTQRILAALGWGSGAAGGGGGGTQAPGAYKHYTPPPYGGGGVYASYNPGGPSGPAAPAPVLNVQVIDQRTFGEAPQIQLAQGPSAEYQATIVLRDRLTKMFQGGAMDSVMAQFGMRRLGGV